MTPEAYRQLARQAGRQADLLVAHAKRYAELQQAVATTIGGTATSSDKQMCALLREAARNSKSAARAFAEAKREAEKAAERAQQEQQQAKQRGEQRRAR